MKQPAIYILRAPGNSKIAAEHRDADVSDAPLSAPSADLPRYLGFKRLLDLFAAVVLIITLSPLLVAVCVFALPDVGSPIFFWQQRIGRNGRPFLSYKVRTLRPPFDWRGQPVPDERRLSWFGSLLRKTRLDEFPQMLNVFVGDMSLIGPRPLLPQDQPDDPTTRLLIRPGITGWAQVNGGVSLTPSKKNELDEWYVRNCSYLLDLRIIARTIRFLFTNKRDAEPRPNSYPCEKNHHAAASQKLGFEETRAAE